jgi:AcrR family transcriptional regulator
MTVHSPPKTAAVSIPISRPASTPISNRERRTQAQRRADTRGAILNAVVECIATSGFQGTTATEIARAAGVTWGAVQHHFGGKDGLLLAVVEDSIDRFAARLSKVPPLEAPLEQRVDAFVDAGWEHFRSPEYRSTFEILLNVLGRKDFDSKESWQLRMFGAWDSIWTQIFADAPLAKADRLMLEHYTISVLSGLATTRILAGSKTDLPDAELAMLRRTLLTELTKPTASESE